MNLDRAIEGNITSFLKKNFNAAATPLIDELLTPSRVPGAKLSPTHFVVAIGQHLVAAHDGFLPKVSDMAGKCLRDFLADERIQYGDGRYEWDYAAAGVVARSYESEFWDEI